MMFAVRIAAVLAFVWGISLAMALVEAVIS